MKFPLSTGQVAQRLGVTEPRLNELVRKGRVRPAPPVVAGRRCWTPEHVARAAEVLGQGSANLGDGDGAVTSTT